MRAPRPGNWTPGWGRRGGWSRPGIRRERHRTGMGGVVVVVLLVFLTGLLALALLPRAHPALPRATGRAPVLGPFILWERWRDRALAARRGGERRRAVITLCRTLAAELRAGQPPEEALRLAVAQAGPSVSAISDSRSLRTAAGNDPHLAALSYVDVCWDVD